jgi:hypothetical protein
MLENHKIYKIKALINRNYIIKVTLDYKLNQLTTLNQY